ncbi:MAG: ZIP family metal transporter [Candidatus Komeilibacteria bacterium]|nr:ZIP family metal transporter [Candidatus Komeilibacteria bacterium]
MLLNIILATFSVSLISFVGLVVFFPRARQKSWVRRFIGLATGTLLASAFFDLLPESIEAFGDAQQALKIVLVSIILFFIIEKMVHYHHCNCPDEAPRHGRTHLAVTNLVGDGIHNFIDGTIIAGAFLTSPWLGLTTTLAVALHEIPQEVADFSILIYSGFSRLRAIIFNLTFGLTSVLGGILVFFLAAKLTAIVPFLLAVAAGNFIYLAMADLIPELQSENNPRYIWWQLAWIAAGIGIIFLLELLSGHS